MTRTAILSISIVSLTALVVGCEKKPTTTPDDAADSGGTADGDAPDDSTSDESKPDEAAKEGGW